MIEADSPLRPVRWGVLGASHFALMAAIPGMQQAPLVDLQALASRSLEKAEQAARSANVPRAYGSYDELLADPEIEAIYNPLPNHLHVAWSCRAARAGKHVLCEKPIAMNAGEAAELLQVQQETGKIIAEAFMVRFHPQWHEVVSLVASGRIGQVRAVQTAFSYRNYDLDNIRNQVAAGGGALYDIGCYAVVTARLVFGAEPLRVSAVCDRDPQSGCDRLTSAILDFGVGQATFVVGTQHVAYQRVHVFGTTGHIEVPTPFNPPYDREAAIYVDDGLLSTPDFTVEQSPEERSERITTGTQNQYTLQFQAFSSAVRRGQPVLHDMRDAVANMRVIDALFRAAESERWERV
jgi:predicted dehydrogenase